MIPFVGTTVGSACVFFLKNSLSDRLRCALTGFAGGVMVAASVWSLIIPAIEMSENLGAFSFFPAVAGFWAGIVFLLLLDKLIPHLHAASGQKEGLQSKLKKNSMLLLAVFLHNLPEGMAVGVVYAGLLEGNADVSLAGALALSVGIALQNFPEGAIISMPLASEGTSKPKSFLWGVMSGVVEPVGAILTLIAARILTPVLPYLLCFAAGAMVFVVVEELIPEMSQGKYSDLGTLMFSLGFSVMMALDVALG